MKSSFSFVEFLFGNPFVVVFFILALGLFMFAWYLESQKADAIAERLQKWELQRKERQYRKRTNKNDKER